MQIRNTAAIALVVSMAVSGCARFHSSPATAPLGGEWHLIELDHARAIPAEVVKRPSIRFQVDSGRVGGSGGCNAFGGQFTASETSIHIGSLISTKRACVDEALNRQENVLFAALNAVDRYAVSHDTLSLSRDVDVRARFTR